MGLEDELPEGEDDVRLKGLTDESMHGRPNPAQRHYLLRGLTQPGGKLPLFDAHGQHIHPALVRACIAHGWAEPWFGNPMKPDWLVCKLTEKGRQVLHDSTSEQR